MSDTGLTFRTPTVFLDTHKNHRDPRSDGNTSARDRASLQASLRRGIEFLGQLLLLFLCVLKMVCSRTPPTTPPRHLSSSS